MPTVTVSSKLIIAARIRKVQVYIDGVPCTDVEHTPGREETELSCLTPTMTVAARKASTSAVVAPYLGTAYHGARSCPAAILAPPLST